MTIGDRARLSRDLLASLLLAAEVRVSEGGEIDLPPVDHRRHLEGRVLEQTIRWMDILSRVALFWTPRRCFLRSFAMASILRQRGAPVQLHIGVADSLHQQGIGGHAWIALHGVALAEKSDPWLRYPSELGSRRDAVFYWTASQRVRSARSSAPSS